MLKILLLQTPSNYAKMLWDLDTTSGGERNNKNNTKLEGVYSEADTHPREGDDRIES